MGERYLEDLRLLKGTFDSKNESGVVANAIARTTSKIDLRILEVGIGEGRAASQFVTQLTMCGRRVHLTGLDLDISRHVQNRSIGNISLLEMDFAALPLSERFDAVLATQSLYYLGRRDGALRKLIDHIVVDGCLLITVWTANCVLHELHKRFAQTPGAQYVTAEILAEELLAMEERADVDVICTSGQVNLGKWRASEIIRRAAFRMLSRSNMGSKFDEVGYAKFETYLEQLPARARRENGTVILRRAGWRRTP